MNENTEYQLKQEVALGDRASRAWELYLKQYVDELNKQYYDEFINTSDIDSVLEIKQKQWALTQMAQSIKSTIETGRLAQQQIDEN
jgi:hypothetical protein